MRRVLLPAAIVGLALVVLWWHASRYYPFLADDALIVLRYSQRLLDGHGLTWTDGPRVEGYSTLTWVLAAAGLGALGIDLVVALRLLGAAGSVATIVAVVWWFRPDRLDRALPALASALALALAGPVAVWTVGGLEQPLVMALLAWATVLVMANLEDGPTVGIGVLYGLLALSRPDGIVFALVAAATLGAVGRRRAAGLLLAVPGAVLAAQVAFRRWYYDDWLPNTAYAKVGWTLHRVLEGGDYVAMGMLGLAGLVVPAAAAMVVRRRSPRIWLLAASLGVWLGYVVAIGGDLFPARRHLAVAVVLLVLLAGELWQELSPRGWLLAGLSLAALAVGQLAVDPQYPRAARERWEWHCRDVARTIGRGLEEEQPLLAVSTGGCLPFWSELPALDLLGLNDRYLAHHRPPTMGQGALGHELGDADYTLRRAPDLIVFCGPDGGARGCHAVEKALDARSEFHQRYRLVDVDGAQIYVRREGGRVGVVRSGEQVRVPALQFGEVVPSADDRLVVPVLPGRPVMADVGELEGRWRAEADASGPVVVDVRGGSVRVTASDGPVELRSVTLTRV